MRIFYFGCWSREKIGHYLYDKTGYSISEFSDRLPDDFPCEINILHGGLIPQRGQRNGKATFPYPQGAAFRSIVNDWTIIMFNDSSADHRPGSHSAFIIKGIYPFEDVLNFARAAYPAIFARFDFEIRLWSNQ